MEGLILRSRAQRVRLAENSHYYCESSYFDVDDLQALTHTAIAGGI